MASVGHGAMQEGVKEFHPAAWGARDCLPKYIAFSESGKEDFAAGSR